MTHTNDAVADAVAGIAGRVPTALQPVSGGDICASFLATFADDSRAFVKHIDDGHAGMFTCEAAGLAALRATATVRVPTVIGLVDPLDIATPTDEQRRRGDQLARVLVLDWIDQARPAADHDERLGLALAELHGARAESFGFEHDNWIGTLHQDNTPDPDWPTFYAQRRIGPLVRAARDVGRLDAATVDDLDSLVRRMPDLAGPPEPPSLLHGDLWGGNALVGVDGYAWLIDPAVYRGHREMDLAMMRLFGGFGPRVFDAYGEVHPLADGAAERVRLWQLYPLLVHVVLFGGGYASSVTDIARSYR